ncbi:proline--tRNA ligase [archaeon]|nr:proline--tRNA ligase [archaeon]MBL7057673.1 proline--tRNA ligase [Candidatus Woesearchaeota archaeon]
MEKEEKGITVKKADDFSEWYSQLIQKAQLADVRFGIQGFIVHRPWGFKIIKKIYEYLEEEVENQEHDPMLFPIAVKEESLMKEKEHAGFSPEVFWVTHAGSKKLEERFALRPTGETQIYPVYSLWFRSHKDLPFKAYQSRHTVFRNEMTTRPFLRGREFAFFETHNVYNTHKEALDQIKLDLKTCDEVIRKKAKIPFLYFKRPAWDKFKGADNTFTPDTIMPDGKRNQLASTHDLGTNFAEAYDIRVTDEKEKKKYVWQTCFGPGVWRIMAAIIAIHGDDKGLIVPFDMAPKQVVIIPIIFKNKTAKEVMNYIKIIEKKIAKADFKVIVDSSDNKPGFKFNHWELFGVPLRIEVGPKEVADKKVTIARRTDGNKTTVKATDIIKEIKKQAKELDSQIWKNAQKNFDHNTRDAKTLDDVKKIMKTHRGFIRIPFCSVDKDGEECAEILKAETQGGNICGTLYPKPEQVSKNDKCAVCKKQAKEIVYVAKSY